jgi:hypothetical protein
MMKMMTMMMMIPEYALYGAENAFLSMICIHPSKENKKILGERRNNGFWKNFCVNNSTITSWVECVV